MHHTQQSLAWALARQRLADRRPLYGPCMALPVSMPCFVALEMALVGVVPALENGGGARQGRHNTSNRLSWALACTENWQDGRAGTETALMKPWPVIRLSGGIPSRLPCWTEKRLQVGSTPRVEPRSNIPRSTRPLIDSEGGWSWVSRLCFTSMAQYPHHLGNLSTDIHNPSLRRCRISSSRFPVLYRIPPKLDWRHRPPRSSQWPTGMSCEGIFQVFSPSADPKLRYYITLVIRCSWCQKRCPGDRRFRRN